MGALLALASAVCYGVVDFAGGLLSRRVHFAVVTFLGQVGGLLLALVAALVVPADSVRSGDMLWARCPVPAAERPCCSSTGA
ncbi:hypothetical protein ACTMTU_06070 [Streptomyces sp. OZ13]|uniref:hypothetical protein n=1 Tax=Streptomyces sp. OZ13 TaxID=3452210 RepID=UPI003F8A330E